jgi:hypothetical protein
MHGKSRFFDRLADSMALGLTLRDAATEAGCAESTAYRVARSKGFSEAVNERRQAAADSCVGRLVRASIKAVSSLEQILDDADARNSDKVAAARAILSAIIPLSDALEIRRRIDALEARAQIRGVI